MDLHIQLNWEVFLNEEWVPFSIFKKGKHKTEIADMFEEISHSALDSPTTQCLILAESLGTDIRYMDHNFGVGYKILFGVGCVTRLESFVIKTGRPIKKVCEGGLITKEFESKLAHVLDI